MSVKSPNLGKFSKLQHSWSPLNDRTVGHVCDNSDIVKVKVRLAAMDSDGDIADYEREDSTDLLIQEQRKHGRQFIKRHNVH